jgi:hypothetical protein
MGSAAAQHYRREGATHSRKCLVAMTLSMDPTIERIHDLGSGAPHVQGFGQVAKTVKKASDGSLGSDTTTPCAANAVGNRRHHITAWLGQLPPQNCTGKILIASAQTGLREEPHACVNAGSLLQYRRRHHGIAMEKALLIVSWRCRCLASETRLYSSRHWS